METLIKHIIDKSSTIKIPYIDRVTMSDKIGKIDVLYCGGWDFGKVAFRLMEAL